LRQALWHLRKAIGDAYLLVDTTSIAFNKTSDFWLDISLLEDRADQVLETEVSVYEGELLPGFYEDWVLLERSRLEAVYERKMQRLLAKLLQDQCWTEVLDWAERWIAQGHVPEAAYRALMMAHAALGELPKVEAVYQRCAEALRQEVDVDPSEETQHLYKSLLAGEKISHPPIRRDPDRRYRLHCSESTCPPNPQHSSAAWRCMNCCGSMLRKGLRISDKQVNQPKKRMLLIMQTLCRRSRSNFEDQSK
jgi:DNA-binding SARP family transcriptional activator